MTTTIRPYVDIRGDAPAVPVRAPSGWKVAPVDLCHAVFAFDATIAMHGGQERQPVDLGVYRGLVPTVVIVWPGNRLAGYVETDDLDPDQTIVDWRDFRPIRDLLMLYRGPSLIRGHYCPSCLGARWRYAWQADRHVWFCTHCGKDAV